MLEFTWGGPEVDSFGAPQVREMRRRPPRRARRVHVHVLVPVRSRGRKAPARERGGVACSSLLSSRRRPGREEASPARRRPRRSALGEARRFTSWFPCAVGAVKRVPGREEAWPACRCSRRSAGPGERRRGLLVARLSALGAARSRSRPGSCSCGRKAPARERGGVACSSLFSSRRRPGSDEASPARLAAAPWACRWPPQPLAFVKHSNCLKSL